MVKKKTKPARGDNGRRLSIFALKGSPEYQGWLNEVSQKSRIAVSVIVRDSIAMWADSKGYRSPPEI